jgi:acyl dehydratase
MTTIANLGMTDVVFPKPVFHGDTLRIETKVMGKRRSKSRPKAGIVTFEHKAYNQHGEEVASCTRQAFMHAKTESE